mmetsp:Transcript_35905/g.114132  ORF Transcript_35905/g.114132 Transcript_35905/m.114132 type:complete len:246 (-) Transcript_35905:118-855(-)
MSALIALTSCPTSRSTSSSVRAKDHVRASKSDGLTLLLCWAPAPSPDLHIARLTQATRLVRSARCLEGSCCNRWLKAGRWRSSRARTPRPLRSKIRKAVPAQVRCCCLDLASNSRHNATGWSGLSAGQPETVRNAISISRSVSAAILFKRHVKSLNSGWHRRPSPSASALPKCKSTRGSRTSALGRESPKQPQRISESAGWERSPREMRLLPRASNWRQAQSSWARPFFRTSSFQAAGTTPRQPR